MLRTADRFARSAAQFKPAWTSSSVAPGTVITFGTFRIESATGTIIPPASRPYSSNISGAGNLTEYNSNFGYFFGDSDLSEMNNLKWIKLANNVVVADRALLCNISLLKINKNTGYDFEKMLGAKSGNIAIIDGHRYIVRLLTETEWDTKFVPVIGVASPSNAQLDSIMHWQYCYSWTASFLSDGRSIIKGYNSATYSVFNPGQNAGDNVGYRPALELIE